MQKSKNSFKQAIVDGGMDLFTQGLTVGTWGNLSIRDPETGLIYIQTERHALPGH